MKEKIDLSALFKSDEDAKKELISLKKYAKNISNYEGKILSNPEMLYEYLEYDNEILYTTGNNVKVLFKGENALPLLWTTPLIDFGAKNCRKMSNYIYLRLKGKGQIKFTLKTERKEKELILDLPKEETLIRKKFKNKGRMFQLKIENVDKSTFTLVAPELHCELDED